jgi:hypothetical protein
MLSNGDIVPEASFSALLERNDMQPRWSIEPGADIGAPEATTVLALRWSDGVVMAGDRRATAGNVIAHSRVKKVYPADDYSAVAISGTAGMAVELTKLFQTELEHYEKIEDVRLSLEGKANYLARMVRGNLPLAFQGLVVVPLFSGFDEADGNGKLYSFDVVGGRYEEQDYATTGSGGAEASRPRRVGGVARGNRGAHLGGGGGFRHRRARSQAGHLPQHRHRHRCRLSRDPR